MLVIGTLILLSAIATIVALVVASPLFRTIGLALESFAEEARSPPTHGAMTSAGTRIGRFDVRSMIAQLVFARTQVFSSAPMNSTCRSKRAPFGASPTQVRAVSRSPSNAARK